jgi:hypothetical protein
MQTLLATATAAASSTPDQVTPAVMGLAVIILLQLSQFFFAWKKDMRSDQAVRREDLTSLRDELLEEIVDITDDLKSFKTSTDIKMEASRCESIRARDEIHARITETAVKLSALVAGQEAMNQTMTAVSGKVDRLIQK